MNEQKISDIVSQTIKNFKDLAKVLDKSSNILYKTISNNSSNDLKILSEKITVINDFKEFTLNINPSFFTTNTMFIVAKKLNNVLKTIPTIVKIAQKNKLENLAKVMNPLPQLATYCLKNIQDIAKISKDNLQIFNKLISKYSKDNSQKINESNEFNNLDEGIISSIGSVGTAISTAIGDLWGSIPFINSDEQRVANSIMIANREAAKNIIDNHASELTFGNASNLVNDLARNGFSSGGGFGSGFSDVVGTSTGWARNFGGALKDAFLNTGSNILHICGGNVNKFEKGVSDFGSSFGGLWNQFVKMFNNGEGATLESIGNFFTSPQFASTLGGLAMIFAIWKGISLIFKKIGMYFKHRSDKKYAIKRAKLDDIRQKRRIDVKNAVKSAGYDNQSDW